MPPLGVGARCSSRCRVIEILDRFTSWYPPRAVEMMRSLMPMLVEYAAAWQDHVEALTANRHLGADPSYELERRSLARRAGWRLPGRNALIGISGPGAVGKDTLIAALAQSRLRPSTVLTTTTRAPRPREKDGVDYDFVNDDQYYRLQATGTFVVEQHRTGRGHYGITHQSLLDALSKADMCIAEESPNSLAKIAAATKDVDVTRDATIIYLVPPGPMFVHLALRFFQRWLESDPTLDEDALHAAIESTLGPRQIDEFSDALALFDKGVPLTFLVNDRIDRLLDLIVDRCDPASTSMPALS